MKIKKIMTGLSVCIFFSYNKLNANNLQQQKIPKKRERFTGP